MHEVCLLYRTAISITVLISFLFFTGCWDRRELNQLGIVLGTAVDQGENGKYRLTVQIVNPGAMRSGKSGGSSGQGNPSLVFSNEGQSLFEAARNTITENSRKLFFSHNQIIIFGEAVGKKGLKPVVDFFERNPEIRMEKPVLIAIGKAEKLLEIQGGLEKLSALEINNSLDLANISGKALKMKYIDFLKRYNSDTTAPIAPIVEVTAVQGQEKYKIHGTAVFKKDKLVGRMDDIETKGMLWVLGKTGGTIEVLKSQNNKGFLSLAVKDVLTQVKPVLQGDSPEINLNIKASFIIAEDSDGEDLTNPKILKSIEDALALNIKKVIENSLEKTQSELKADVFGFGEEFERSYPRDWPRLKSNWEKIFQRVVFKLEIHTQMLRSGDKLDPSN